MHTDINALFTGLWQDYVQITPSAQRIHALLAGDEQRHSIVNDHIALRTFNLEKTRLDKLAAHFLALGYEAKDSYTFTAKKLDALHFEHPDTTQPKVFISELRVNALSADAQRIIHHLVDQMAADAVTRDDFLYSGRHWQLSLEDYEQLLSESEYAAWMAAWGFRANHFTVSVNHLQQFKTLEDVNARLKAAGFVLNTAGGEIKGGPAVYLAQSAIMADRAEVDFNGVSKAIPSCFYEFAQRFVQPDGLLYHGFVEASADKIFESTNSM